MRVTQRLLDFYCPTAAPFDESYTEIVRLLPCTEDALDWASEMGYAEIVKLLLVANKDFNEWELPLGFL